MKILLVASEVEPFAKTGGLADVAAALPKALAGLGHDVRIVMPLYRQVNRKAHGLQRLDVTFPVVVGSQSYEVQVWTAPIPKSRVITYFVEQPAWFDREGLYQANGKDHPDNLARFSGFSQAALRLLPLVAWRPDVVHCHDWQTALVCAQLQVGAIGQEAFFAPLSTVLTIHNLAYQGLFPKEQWPLAQLPVTAFTVQGLEFYGQVNCLKGGIVSADMLTTVSPTYAQEIQTRALGCGLEGVLTARRDELVGIVNGIDVETWNPQADAQVAAPYSAAALAGKSLCKLALQKRQGLPEQHDLLIGMIQRLAEQKGIDIFVQALERLMTLPVQLVLLGTGDPAYQQQLTQLAARFPQQFAVNVAFDDALAHQIEAGADAFLMPSRFEPCGLNQLYSMRYGTVPIVRRVGGLADTVVDVTSATIAAGTATGFMFEDYSAAALIEAVERAVAAFRDHTLWARLIQHGMRYDGSWDHSARDYVKVYERVLAAHLQHSRS